ncbi:MAG: BON domain-containing protein [Isosphaeraceae bacterium]
MKKIYGITAASLFALALACFGVASRAQQGGVAERAGEKLDEFGRAIRDGFEKAGETVVGGISKTGETVREGLVKARDSVQGMGVYSRVYSRIHWDKTLHASNVLLRAEGGVITLRGVVPDDAARAKALTLTVETVGVTRVINQLTVLHPSEESAPAPASSRRSKRAAGRESRDAEPER